MQTKVALFSLERARSLHLTSLLFSTQSHLGSFHYDLFSLFKVKLYIRFEILSTVSTTSTSLLFSTQSHLGSFHYDLFSLFKVKLYIRFEILSAVSTTSSGGYN